jgi:hypothetical protein
LLDQVFSLCAPVHIGEEVGELRAGFEKLAQRLHLAGDGFRGEVIHLVEGDIDGETLPFVVREGVRHGEVHAGLHVLHELVEVVHIDLAELSLRHRRERLLGLAGQIRHNAHDKWEFDFFLRTVDKEFILNVHAWCPVTLDELGAALGWFRHGR